MATEWTPVSSVTEEPMELRLDSAVFVPLLAAVFLGGLVVIVGISIGITVRALGILFAIAAFLVFSAVFLYLHERKSRNTTYAVPDHTHDDDDAHDPLPTRPREPMLRRHRADGTVEERPLYGDPPEDGEIEPWVPTWADVLRFALDAEAMDSTSYGKLHEVGWSRDRWEAMRETLMAQGWATWRVEGSPRQGWDLLIDQGREDAIRRMVDRGEPEPWLCCEA